MRDMFRTAADAAYSLLGFGDPEENNREEENPEGDNPEEDNLQTIKRKYLGEEVAPQSVDTFEEIWTSSTDDENTLQRYREDLQDKDKPCPFIWLPVRRTQQGEASTIMHEMILGSHDQFRHFIQLFLDNDARRFHLFQLFIYGGLNLNGDHNEALADNRPIELAVNEMLNIENPAEERAEIRRNLGYLLAHFIRDNPVSLANNQGLLIILQRFINGDDDQYPVSEEARDRCLYHISSIWADIHQHFLTLLRDSRELGGIEVLQDLLPEGYVIPEDGSVPENIENFLEENIRRLSLGEIADEDFRHLLEFEAVRQCANSESIRCAIYRGATEAVRALLDIDSVSRSVGIRELRTAVQERQTDMVRMLLEIDNVKNFLEDIIDGRCPGVLLDAAVSPQLGHAHIAEMLLSNEAIKRNAHEEGNYAIKYAARCRGIEIVNLLLQCDKVRENLYVRDNQVLGAAIEGRNKEIVKILLQDGDIRENAHEVFNTFVLFNAIEYRDTDMIRLLLGIDNVRNNAHRNNNSVLKHAAESGATEIVDLLLEIPSVRNAQDGERIYQDRLDAGANIPLDRAPRPAEDFAGHAQGIAEPHRQTGEDGNDHEHNIRQDPHL